MADSRYQEIKAVVVEALARPADERAAFVQVRCEDDPELQKEVESLLAFDDAPVEIVEKGVVGRGLKEEIADAVSGLLDLTTAARRSGPTPNLIEPQFDLGPCRLEATLGSGGFGAVYRARMLQDRDYAAAGDEVAVKVLHAWGLEDGFERFLREGNLGQRTRHPRVVEVFDIDRALGPNGELFFLVMELVEGRTLQDLMRDLGPLSEALVRETARQVASGLAALHKTGIVHRDLKPSNVLVTRDYEMKLADLGIAILADASERLTKTGQFVGTLRYAAPEQITGGPPQMASDLYSLGVVLYEAATGTPPFDATHTPALVWQHLSVVPEPVRRRNANVTPLLEAIIACLLEKEPTRRFRSADELLAVLQEDVSSSWWRDHQRSQRHAELSRRASEFPFVGRRDELKALLEDHNALADRAGRAVVLEGEAGIGKTRIVEELLTHLQATAPQTRCLIGAGSPGPRIGPGPLAQAVVGLLGEAQLGEKLVSFLPQAPGLADGFAALLRGVPPAAGVEPVSRDSLGKLYIWFLNRLAARGPVVWVIEDLHFTDQEDQAIIAAMGQAAVEWPVLFLLTTRPAAGGQGLAKDFDWPNLDVRSLDRLRESAVRQLLEKTMAAGRLARLGDEIVRKCDGNPFFACELVRELERSGVSSADDLDADSPTKIVELTLPASIRDLLEARLAHLEEDDRSLLYIAAVQGFRFEPHLLAAASERKPLAVLEQLASLERREHLVRSRGAAFEFDHHLLQEWLYESMPRPLAQAYHGALADAYRETKQPDPTFLAEHYLKAGRSSDGLAALQPALDRLVQQCASVKILELTDLAMQTDEMQRDKRARCDLHLSRIDTLSLLGRREDEQAEAQKAISLAEQAKDPALHVKAHAALGRALFDQGPEALPVLEETLSEALAVGTPELEALARGRLGEALFRQARYDQALPEFKRQAELFLMLGEVKGAAEAHAFVGEILMTRNHVDDAKHYMRMSLDASVSLGHRRGEIRVLGNLAMLSHWVGDLKTARPMYERSVECSQEIGFIDSLVLGLLNVSMVDVYEGQLEQARRRQADAAQVISSLGSPIYMAYHRQLQGHLAEARQEPEVFDKYREAELQFEELGLFEPLAETILWRSMLHHEVGHSDDAQACLSKAAGLVHSHGLSTLHSVVDACRVAFGGVHNNAPDNLERLRFDLRLLSYWALTQTGGSQALREKFRQLVEQVGEHLCAEAGVMYWNHSPFARRFRTMKGDTYS